MSVNAVLKQFKNAIAPEVKVEQQISISDSIESWFDLMDDIAASFGLIYLGEFGNTYRFKYPGNFMVKHFELEIFLGVIPDQEAYQNLLSYVDLKLINKNIVEIKLFENMIGTKGEQVAFQQVLQYRLDRMIQFLEKTS